MTDERWKDLAERTRQVLGLLGYTIEPQCMPGEDNPCGGTFAEHFAANLAGIKAVTDHHLAHLGVEFVLPIYGPAYDAVAENLDSDCPAHSTGKGAGNDRGTADTSGG